MDGMHQTQSLDLTHTAKSKRKFSSWRQWTKLGPGIFVAIGYIDPGNWSTDLAGGAYAGYALLSIVFFSGLIAMLLQIMSARLGIVTGKDLAQLSAETWPRLRWSSWMGAEIAIIATDLAEVIGSAIALKLLFGIPIVLGIILTVLDVLLLLTWGQKKPNVVERTVAFLLFIISCGFVYEIAMAQPAIHDVICGFVPSVKIIQDTQLLFLAIGIIGATIMPHNLYLHSNLVLQHWQSDDVGHAVKRATMDTIIFLSCAILLNSALIILAASVFHPHHGGISQISEASQLLSPLLGSSLASIVFAIMLLASGQSATITGTLAGQVVLNGFMRKRIAPWIRRLLTRSLALVIALVTIIYFGEKQIANLLISSQVLLSLQLPCAMLPLLLLTSNKSQMGVLANSSFMRQLGFFSLIIIVMANAVLMVSLFK